MIITSPTTFTSSVDTVTRKGGIFKISALGALEYISRQRPIIEATTLSGLIELAQLGTTIIDGGYIKTELVDSNTLLADVLFVGDMLEGGYLKPSLIDVSTLATNMSLGALAYESVVEAAMLGTTLISGGFIKTNLIDTDAILANVVVVGDLGAVASLDAIELTNLGTTIISGGYIRTSLLHTDVLVVGEADLTAQNVALNVANVASWPASTVGYYAMNPAEVINYQTVTISGGRITTGSLHADKIIGNTISAGQMAAGAITAISLGAGSVVAGKVAANAISAVNINARSITADRIAAESLTVTEINGLARINGNRLNVIACGSVVMSNGDVVTIEHNLGRYVVMAVAENMASVMSQTINSFILRVPLGLQPVQVTYAYI